VAPVPASKKFWIFNGSVEQYPSVLTADQVHSGNDCTDCHGGDISANSSPSAHDASFVATVTAEACVQCHKPIVDNSAGGLHTTLGGYNTILMQRGFNMSDPTSDAAVRFEEQCTKCHTATDLSAATACGQCHISVPATAGGGLISGHGFNRTPSMDNNCTACHGSRVKDEYYGQNIALLARNKAAFDADSPWKGADFELAPDVHKTAGFTCMNCHRDADPALIGAGDEMHGIGHQAPDAGDRYDVTSVPQCSDCHDDGDAGFAAVSLHTDYPAHLENMDCQVCHALPYKNCFSCHTDVSAAGTAFFKINGEDPTWADRTADAVAVDPDAKVAPDALITFRAGNNPRFGELGMKKYSVLRHVPVDKDVFQYPTFNEVNGIIPATDGDVATKDMGSLSTWKYATPHTIARNTAITTPPAGTATACANCHGDDYIKFWLTDAVGAAQGWVPEGSDYLPGEEDANAGNLLTDPMPQ
jgi:thiosulfate/3-mercaptopyruvate sulfurtransferase